jgi:hypothetical protein
LKTWSYSRWSSAFQILHHGQARENLAAFRHQGQTHAHDLVGRQARQFAAHERDATLLRLEQARDGLHHRGLAGAVVADQRDHLARVNLQADAFQRADFFPVDGVDAVELEHRVAERLHAPSLPR